MEVSRKYLHKAKDIPNCWHRRVVKLGVAWTFWFKGSSLRNPSVVHRLPARPLSGGGHYMHYMHFASAFGPLFILHFAPILPLMLFIWCINNTDAHHFNSNYHGKKKERKRNPTSTRRVNPPLCAKGSIILKDSSGPPQYQ